MSEDGAVQGSLSTSRALGDADLARYLSVEPSVSVTKRMPDDEFVIVACDGVWDVLSDQEAVAIVRPLVRSSLQLAADRLRDIAWLVHFLLRPHMHNTVT